MESIAAAKITTTRRKSTFFVPPLQYSNIGCNNASNWVWLCNVSLIESRANSPTDRLISIFNILSEVSDLFQSSKWFLKLNLIKVCLLRMKKNIKQSNQTNMFGHYIGIDNLFAKQKLKYKNPMYKIRVLFYKEINCFCFLCSKYYHKNLLVMKLAAY